LPIFVTPQKGFKKDKIIHILLDPQFDHRYLCTNHPTLVENNVAFVVDISKLKSKDDIRADDLGAWKCTGSWILTALVEINESTCNIVSKQSENSQSVKSRCQHHVHGTDRDLHRMIAYVDSPVNSSVSCLVQYR
jgi:hypothetical protein